MKDKNQYCSLPFLFLPLLFQHLLSQSKALSFFFILRKENRQRRKLNNISVGPPTWSSAKSEGHYLSREK